MKEVYKYRFYIGSVADLKNLEQHFADMAERGWMIDKMGAIDRYRAVEPCKKRFFVDILPQLGTFDYPESEDVLDYRRMCEESGWKLVTANRQIHVFCADDDNPEPIPIHTDNAIHAKIYAKTCLKYELLPSLFCLATLIYSSQLWKGAELMLSNLSLSLSLGFFILIIGLSPLYAFSIRWYLKARQAAKKNLPLPRTSPQGAKMRGAILLVACALYIALLIAGFVLEGLPIVIVLVSILPLSGIGAGLLIRRQIEKRERTRRANIIMTIAAIAALEIAVLGGTVMSFRGLPFDDSSDTIGDRPVLTLAAVGSSAEPRRATAYINGTPLVPVDYEYWLSGSEGSIQMRVYRLVNEALAEWLYSDLAEDFIEDYSEDNSFENGISRLIFRFSGDDAAYWGAERLLDAGSSSESGRAELLLINRETVIRISASGDKLDLNTFAQAVKGLW